MTNGAPRPQWRKSTRSSESLHCVEVAMTGAGALVRDSKDPDGPSLAFSADSWRSFVAGLHAGDFDLGRS